MTAQITSRQTRTGPSATPDRRRDLDAMRMIVVLGLILFHSARVFDDGDFYVKNDPQSELVTAFIGFAATWGMPLLFTIAGMGIWYSLRSRTTTEFGIERVRRLLVPLVFGVAVIVPPQLWTELRGDPGYRESYWDFLPRFFDVGFDLSRFPFVVTSTAPDHLFETAHLWFVVILFAYSMLLLPVIWGLRRPSGLRLIDRAAAHADRPWFVVAAGLPMALSEAVLGSEVGLAIWNRHSYVLFILYGYVLATDPRFGAALRRHRAGALVGGLATFVVAGAMFAIGSDDPGVDRFGDMDAVSVAMRALKGLSGWLWVVAIMGFAAGVGRRREPAAVTRASRRRTLATRFSAYTAEALLPVYVLHQTVIVLLAYPIVRWTLPGPLKYLALCILSFAVIIVVYDAAVRRNRVTRWLFGMKPRRR